MPGTQFAPKLTSESTSETWITRGPTNTDAIYDTLHFPQSFAGSIQIQFVMEGSANVASSTPVAVTSPSVTTYPVFGAYTRYFETNMNTGASTSTIIYTACFNIANQGIDNYIQFTFWTDPTFNAIGYKKKVVITTIPKNMNKGTI